LFSQRKTFETGEKISKRENASQNIIHTLLTICKKTLKRISKRIHKNKTSGASVVQNVKYEESIHANPKRIYIGLIPSNLRTYLMQTSSILHLYICFGLCWHQSPKRGRLKGK
jgi:3-methyladenine DNA glycosylase AlkD